MDPDHDWNAFVLNLAETTKQGKIEWVSPDPVSDEELPDSVGPIYQIVMDTWVVRVYREAIQRYNPAIDDYYNDTEIRISLCEATADVPWQLPLVPARTLLMDRIEFVRSGAAAFAKKFLEKQRGRSKV